MNQRKWLAVAAATLMVLPAVGSADTAAALDRYAGRYPWDDVDGASFLDAPLVEAAVTAAVEDPGIRQALLVETRDGVAGKILVTDHGLLMHAFDPASGGDVSWALLISPRGAPAAACFSSGVEPGVQGADWYMEGERIATRYEPCPSEADRIPPAIRARMTPTVEPEALQWALCYGYPRMASGETGMVIKGDYHCSIPAGSEILNPVKAACREDALCKVEAMVLADPRRERREIRQVLSVQRVDEVPDPAEPYRRRAGRFYDGVYARQARGCDRGGADERVSLDLSRPSGGALQWFDQYCAVLTAEGEAPAPGEFHSTLQLRCGDKPEQDAALRGGATGRQASAVLRHVHGRTISIDGSALVRCPIRRADTPRWWIQRPPFNGYYPSD
ncbi:MAG: hypothetical protein H2067_13615 [Alcanivorax sp.]|nr:hypothetical protein [Alcanivorax sp.]